MSKQSPTIDVICDLRQLNIDADDIGSVKQLWQRITNDLIDQSLSYTQPIHIRLPEGKLTLWSANSDTDLRVSESTQFAIVDLIRNPTLLYSCTVCHEYGPLRCTTCERNENQQTRLCSKHAHTIKDELSAYCSNHIPKCGCRSNCTQNANFRCRRCHKLFGNHYLQHHPNDNEVDYCQLCYRILFERCEDSSCYLLGKSKCAYRTRDMEGQCGSPLCAKHSYQWKIWGPHNRGVTLCKKHKMILAHTDPADLLFMMLTARSPYARRGKRQSLPNPFRLRRIINRNRSTPLTFDDLGYAITSLNNQVSSWGYKAENNYRFMSKRYFEATKGLSSVEKEILLKVKGFYQSIVGQSAAQEINKVEIVDRYYKPGGESRYRVKIYLTTANKGQFIGRHGTYINKLRDDLKLEIDLV